MSTAKGGLRGALAHPLAPITLLLGATVAALVWANSPLESTYRALFEMPVGITLGDAGLKKPLLLWINDGLMGIFFFLVGLEIKREVLVGELSRPRKAALALAAAVGGMVVPALLFRLVVGGEGVAAAGWGIPMATDIAFALGLLTLVGDRAPVGLKVFLTALAIVDDIGAVLVIAVFYTDAIALVSLGAGLVLFGLAILANRSGVRNQLFYFLLGSLVWLAFLKSGVHATVAALLMAFAIPARAKLDEESLDETIRGHLGDLRTAAVGSPRADHALDAIGKTVSNARAPLRALEHQLHPIVGLLVLPVFALANAGVTLDGDLLATAREPLTQGIVLGLVVGKPVGIVAMSMLAVRTRLASLPEGVGWRHVVGAGCLSGIGFTMALFIGGLAFTDDALVGATKTGILAASLVSAVVGLAILRTGPRATAPQPSSGSSSDARASLAASRAS